METSGKLGVCSTYGRQRAIDIQARACEDLVSDALRALWNGDCYVFDGLIIPTALPGCQTAQIDHIVVSRHGVFCVETKSHHGCIYGRVANKDWKQYIQHGKYYEVYNPFRQNYFHAKAIEHTLGSLMKTSAYLFVCYPNARKIMLDGIQRDASIAALTTNIHRYTQIIYTDEEVTAIVRRLSVAIPYKHSLQEIHIINLQKHLSTSL